MNVETLEDLFGHQLQRVYYVERTQVELLERMAANASSEELGDRLADHREATVEHVARLEGVFEALGRHPQASRSRTVDGLVESWRQHADSAATGTSASEAGPTVPSAIEIALTADRLEIRAYESLLRLAGRLAYTDDVVEPLETTLSEERTSVQAFEDLESELSILETVAADDR